MSKEEKKQIISLIKEIKNYLRYYEDWRCLSVTKPQKSYSYYELTARWFRKQKYKVELGYGTLPSERDCYITIYKKIRTMSKAEERAFERCPQSENLIEELRNKRRRAIFIEGYHQAEKDLELTWKDIKIILDAENDILRECNSQKELVIETYPKEENYYSEILKRYRI